MVSYLPKLTPSLHGYDRAQPRLLQARELEERLKQPGLHPERDRYNHSYIWIYTCILHIYMEMVHLASGARECNRLQQSKSQARPNSTELLQAEDPSNATACSNASLTRETTAHRSGETMMRRSSRTRKRKRKGGRRGGGAATHGIDDKRVAKRRGGNCCRRRIPTMQPLAAIQVSSETHQHGIAGGGGSQRCNRFQQSKSRARHDSTPTR